MYIVRNEKTGRKLTKLEFSNYETARQFARKHIRRTKKDWKETMGQYHYDTNPFLGFHDIAIVKKAA